MNRTENDIRILSRAEIDIGKWDQCLLNSENSLIYGMSFYLDSMAKNWSALVMNDYEAVMPLTWNRKYGIRYLYQPPFTAQLGIFFMSNLKNFSFDPFIDRAKDHFRFCEIHLNSKNYHTDAVLRANYTLDLSKSYLDIRKGYQKRMSENLKKTTLTGLKYESTTFFEKTIDLYQQEYGKQLPHLSREDFTRFKTLCNQLTEKKMILIREVKNSEDDLLSTGIFFKDKHRIYNIMPVTLHEGRIQNANIFLLDQLILELSEGPLTLDFEGSEIEGIAAFYRKFGTVNQPYPFLRYNHLPFPLHLFK